MECAIDSFVRRIPKTETHLHLEGALPYGMLRELDPERFPEDPEFRRKGYRYPDFIYFENTLIEHAAAWYDSIERYHLAAKRIFSDLRDQNVRYVETSIHLAMIEILGVDGRELVSSIKEAAPPDMEVRIVGGLLRNGYTEGMKSAIDELHTWDALDGIDLHGQEWLELEDWSAPVWRRCKDAGKIIKAHAGEFGGPEKIYEALDILGAQRVQHGVRSIEDPALVARLADEEIVLDVCPISNERLRVFESLEAHPLRLLKDSGVICTINTDDPLCFANTLVDEYTELAERMEFAPSDLAEFAKNGFRTADLERSEIEGYLAAIDRELELFEGNQTE